MQLLLVRHGVAQEREDFAPTGLDDSQRPLTEEGMEKMRGVAAGLRRIVDSIDLLASSPLVRAMQTAEILGQAFDHRRVETVFALEPERVYADFAAWLRSRSDADVIVAVGHEPHLGGLATWLLTGGAESHTPFRKGGACLLEIHDRAGPASATLIWSMPPSLLRRLGR